MDAPNQIVLHSEPSAKGLSRSLALLRIWHRWLGVILSPFVLVMASTGIVINHKGPKFFKELHTGKLFGHFGVYFLDGIAVCLILLVLSGVFLWLGPHLIRRRRDSC